MTHALEPGQHPAVAVLAAVAVLQAAAQQHRLRILIALRDGPAQTSDLCELLGVTRSVLARHMRHLRVAELIVQHRQGARLRYALADEGVAAMVGAVLALAETREHLHRIGRT